MPGPATGILLRRAEALEGDRSRGYDRIWPALTMTSTGMITVNSGSYCEMSFLEERAWLCLEIIAPAAGYDVESSDTPRFSLSDLELSFAWETFGHMDQFALAETQLTSTRSGKSMRPSWNVCPECA